MKRRNDRGVVFAAARPGDGQAMLRLTRNAYQLYVNRIGQEPAPMRADYEAIATAGEALLVWQNNDLVGMLVTRLEEHNLLIENLAVDPAFQGSGLGSELLAEAEHIARSRGRDGVRLYTNEAMIENLAYYIRRGYQETHRKTEDGYDRVYFLKQMDPDAPRP